VKLRLFDAGARREGPEVVHDRIVTVPNAITLVRLLGLPLFGWLLLGADRPGAAFWTLAAIAGTDWIDGYVARRFDQVSRLGKLIDPLVDRAVLATAAIVLMVAGILHPGVIAALVLRDAAVLGGALVLFGGIPPIPVTKLGKAATALLLAGLPAYLLAAVDWAGAGAAGVVAPVLTGLGLIGYYIAGLQYARLAAAYRQTGRAQATPPS
jgi:cardiolipin synthase (CMP-forming)